MTDAAKLRVLVGVEGAAEASSGIKSMGAATKSTGKEMADASRTVGETLRTLPNAAKVSVGQTAAAFRQLPMQMQDIAVSLAGGMNPLTVAMQQVPQITGSFGGVRETITALRGAIAPAAVAAGAFAVSLGAVVLAAYQGSQEMGAYDRALIMTGNRIGLTSGRLAEMADRMGDLKGVTEGQAAGALALLAGTAGITRDRIEAITTTALQLEAAGGPAVAETAKAFSDLAKAPVDASIKLHEQYGYLTAAVYRQIKALDDQGKHTEAAKVAQDAYLMAMQQRVPQLEQSLGTLERAWKAVRDQAGKAWSAMLDIGREDTIDQKITALRAKLEANARRTDRADSAGPNGKRQGADAQAAELRAELAALQEQQRLAQRSADAKSAAAQAADVAIANDKDKAKKKASTADEFAAERAAAQEWAKAMQDFSRAGAAAEAQTDDLSKSQARLVEYLQSPRYRNASEPMRQLVLADAYAAISAEQHAEARKRAAQIATEATRAHEQWITSLDRSAQSVAQQVQALQDENQAETLAVAQKISLAEAIQLVTIERLKEKQVGMMGDEQAVAAIQREIDKRRELAAEIRRKDGREETRRAEEGDKKWLEKYFSTDLGDDMAKSFDAANKSIGALLRSFTTLGKAQANYNEARKRAGNDAATLARADAQYQQDQLAGYASLALAARGMFEEGSDGYRVMNVAAAAAGMAYAAAGVANQASGDPYTAFARMAAMAAAMASLGFAVGGALGGGGGGKSRPAATPGSGTTLGDSGAASSSIADSIDRLTSVDTLTMQYSGQMLATLRSIDAGINGLGAQVGRDMAAGELFAGASIAERLGLKFSAPAQTVGDIAQRGLQLQDNASQERAWLAGIRAGMSKSQIRDLMAATVSPYAAGFQEVLLRVADSLQAAAQPLGASGDQVRKAIARATVRLDTIDLRGKTGEQIAEAISAALGKAGDQIAQQALPGFERFTQLGEAYYETVVRVGAATEEARAALAPLHLAMAKLATVAGGADDVAAELVRNSIAARESTAGVLSSVGRLVDGLDGSAAELADAYAQLVDARRTLGAVGVQATALTSQLLAGAGGLAGLVDSLSSYSDWALSEGERLALATQALRDQFGDLGLTLPATAADYRALVAGIDTSTEAGQRLLGQVLGLAEGYGELASAQQAVADERAGLEQQLLELQGDTAAIRAAELDKLDASNRALQERIWALQDEREAAEALVRSGQSVAAFIAELRGGTSTAASLSLRRATYATDLAAAQAGDADATTRVVASARSLVDAIKTSATDPIQLARDTSRIAAQLAALPATIAYQADQAGQTVSAPAQAPTPTATVQVPSVPAVPTPAATTAQASEAAALREELAAMRRELEAMRAEMRSRGDALVTATTKTARILDNVTANGNAVSVVSGG